MGVLVCLDNCGIPVPGQTVLVLAAVYAGTGRMSIAAVVAIAVVAAVVGNSLGYLIGRTGGHAFVHRWGRYVRLTPERMAKAERFFDRHGAKVVTGARFVDGLRQTNGIIAGTSEMPRRRFVPANVVGALLWVGVWASVGYFAGDNLDELYRQAVRYQVLLLVLAGAVVLALLARTLLRRLRSRRGGGPGGPAGREGTTDQEGTTGPGGSAGPDENAGPGGPARPDGRPTAPGQRSGMTSNEDA
ncbi:DedA family protein [Kitasatospora terrestris]|uniref:DedA family protein n=1 Tax=Kitasatospora terrestris TaxID=258051 RepID=UPI0031E528D1